MQTKYKPSLRAGASKALRRCVAVALVGAVLAGGGVVGGVAVVAGTASAASARAHATDGGQTKA